MERDWVCPTELDQDLTEMGRTLQIRSGGTRLKVFEDPDHPGQASFEILSSSERMQKTSMIAQLVDFLYDLQAAVIDHIVEPCLPILTEHKRGDQMFCGHPNYRGSPWRDWVLVDWGTDGKLPSRIWCFVQLLNMLTGTGRIQFGGVTLGRRMTCMRLSKWPNMMWIQMRPRNRICLYHCSWKWGRKLMMGSN